MSQQERALAKRRVSASPSNAVKQIIQDREDYKKRCLDFFVIRILNLSSLGIRFNFFNFNLVYGDLYACFKPFRK